MKKIVLVLLAFAGILTAKAQDDKVLLTIDGEQIRQSEFLYIYEKNNQEGAVDPKNIDEYLNLFINFRLKVHEAELLGMDTTRAFIDEFNGYRAQAANKYMVCPAAEDSMLRLSYNHIAHDRRAAHIAIKVPQNATPEQEDSCRALIDSLRVLVTQGHQIKKGKKMIWSGAEDFYATADAFSSDDSKVENHGELGWITPFRYVWPLEKAVYETAVGQVTPVFRTAYGFHIALVEEERDHEEIHASHIMKMVPRGNDSIDLIAKAQIDSIYRQLTVDQIDFYTLAQSASDDRGSAMRGGDLSWFSRGMMVRPFEEAAFAMTEPGQISEPIRSNFGWHIIQLHEKRGVQSFEEMEPDLRRKMTRDERNQEVQAAFLQQIRREYNLPEDMDDSQVLAVENSHLEEKYPEFNALMKEYHDGILLFNLSLEQVWDKGSTDTLGLTDYLNTHRSDFAWEEPRYKGFVIYCKSKAAMKVVKNILRNAETDSIESYINHRINSDSLQIVRVERGLWKKGQNAAVDKLQWKSGDFAPSEEYPYVFLAGKQLNAPEEFTDERGPIVSAYQDYLDKLWVEALRAKYAVEVNEEALTELKQR